MNLPYGALLIFGIIAAATGWFLSGWSIHKANKNEHVSDSLNNATSDKVWFSLTSAQQEDLTLQTTFIEQEEWVEDNVDVSLRSKLTPERVVVALANKSFISLGSGSPKRLANIIDLVEVSNKQPSLTFKQKKAKVHARLTQEKLLEKVDQRSKSRLQPYMRISKKR